VAWSDNGRRATATRGNNDHLAEQCKDELCPRLPCQMFKAGQREAAEREYTRGWCDGEAAGFLAQASPPAWPPLAGAGEQP
jgi:hypothetical protein